MDLTPGTIGVSGTFPELVELAAKNGFESIAPDAGYLGGLSDEQLKEFLDSLKAKKLVLSAAGLPVEFRRDAATHAAGMKDLPAFAKALQRAGVTRVGTYIMPNHAELTYRANFQQHAERLREVATVLGDHGLRFGLEYVGPKTLWTAKKHPFVHSMAEMKELLAAIDRPNMGFVLDSWHWYTAQESEADLLTLTNRDVVACDLNDAPVGRTVDEQIDQQRELPAATAIIDVKTFLNALIKIGYNGPVRAEPFNAALRAMPREAAVAATAVAMRKAFAQVGG
jgi:sugar phosphate isomerase/epimerase